MDNLAYLKKLVNDDVKERESSIPDYLLKFQSLEKGYDENIFQSLENNRIWFSSIKYLNDPEEFKGLFLDKDTLKNAGFSPSLIKHFNGFFDLSSFGVTCLSGCDIYNRPMWAHYANESKGFVIEYEVVKKAAIHEVVYSKDKKPIGKYMVQLKNELDATNGLGNENAIRIAKRLMDIFYIKNDYWALEKEYRIVQPIDNNKGQEYPINHLGMRVKRIIAGVNCNKSNVERLNIISNQLGCGNVYALKINEDTFALEMEKVKI